MANELTPKTGKEVVRPKSKLATAALQQYVKTWSKHDRSLGNFDIVEDGNFLREVAKDCA